MKGDIIFYHLYKLQVLISYCWQVMIFFVNGLENFPFSPFFQKILASTLIIQNISNFANNSN